MNIVSACFATSAKAEEKSAKPKKFPPRPAKKPLTGKEAAERTLARFPKIMERLAK